MHGMHSVDIVPTIQFTIANGIYFHIRRNVTVTKYTKPWPARIYNISFFAPFRVALATAAAALAHGGVHFTVHFFWAPASCFAYLN